MSLINASIDDRDVRRALDRLGRKLDDLSPVMRVISGILADAVEENLEQEGRPTHWAALKPATIAARERKGYWPGRILQQRGELAASIQPGHGRRQAWAGTNKVYAAIHHFGGMTGRGHKTRIPARPYMVLGDDDKGEILNAISRHLSR
jgi:phage virion morphogenesis protein